ncbi:MAG: ATP-binding protein [Candidatus Rokuibacteriota bacterium]
MVSLRPVFRSRLAIRLTVVVVAVTAIGMAVLGLVVTWALETRAVASLEAGLVTAARVLHDPVATELLPGAPPARVQQAVERYGTQLAARVTVIAPDGTVLGDSERDAESLHGMENHGTRPEVRAALARQVGRDIRRSRTLDLDMLYVAIPVQESGRVTGVIRLALPLAEVARASAWVSRTVAGGVGLAFAVALVAALFISRRVTRPVARMQDIAHRLAAGEFDRAVPVSGHDEIADLGRSLNLMALRLRDKIDTLEAERAKVGAMLDNMVEGVIAVDARGHILLVNPGARAIFGIGAEPVEGRPFLEVVRYKELFDLVERCQAGGDGERYRREVELAPPVSRTVAAQAVTVAFAPPGRGVLLVIHDVTALRRLERVKTEFVANVSHELRTPLTAIRGYLETLLDGAIDEPANARRFLAIANTHAERLGRLVDDLLQLSNIETGKLVLTVEPTALGEVSAGTVAMFEGQAERGGIALHNAVPGHLRVQADRDRLAQILVNLLDNAVKYTPPGGQITLAAETEPSGFVAVRVVDTGIGIPSTDLPRITERFHRVDKARSRGLGGTGLGLAIVKHLVQAHGGELSIDSELGRGTTVRFTLPAA